MKITKKYLKEVIKEELNNFRKQQLIKEVNLGSILQKMKNALKGGAPASPEEAAKETPLTDEEIKYLERYALAMRAQTDSGAGAADPNYDPGPAVGRFAGTGNDPMSRGLRGEKY